MVFLTALTDLLEKILTVDFLGACLNLAMITDVVGLQNLSRVLILDPYGDRVRLLIQAWTNEMPGFL